jgi:hypothetical protein
MYSNPGTGPKFGMTFILLALVLFATAASAQTQVGDNLSMTLNGNLGYGYTGTFGNYEDSSHGQGVVANADLQGYYFHPNFLSFDVRPYYDRGSASGLSQSITQSNGIGASVGLFGGSNFPGTVTYGLDFAHNSEFAVGGLPTLVGDTTSRNFSVNWSELLPGLPHVNATYYKTSASSTLLSADNSKNQSRSDNLNLNSDYRLAGFDLRGYLNYNNSSYTSPAFLTGEEVTFGGHGTTYGINASHGIPFGGIGLGMSHSSYGSDQGYSGSGNNFFEGAGVTLFRNLSLNESFNYTTNTSTSLGLSYLNGATTTLVPDRDSSGMYFLSSANLLLGWGLTLNGNYSYRQATFAGREYSASQYGGGVSFNRQQRFLGFITASVGVIDTATKEGNSGAGLVASVGANKRVHGWETSADFSYFQTIQTLYAIANTSSYSFGGGLHRKITPQIFWSASYRGTRSGLAAQEGTSFSADSGTSSFSFKRYSVTGLYSRSNGLAVLSANGTLVPSQLPSLVPDNTYVYNANVWGVNGSAALFRRLVFSGGYTNVASDTRAGLFATASNGDRYFTRMDYTLRKFAIQGGFSRVIQAVSTIPGGPRETNAFFVTLTRWFNVF